MLDSLKQKRFKRKEKGMNDETQEVRKRWSDATVIGKSDNMMHVKNLTLSCGIHMTLKQLMLNARRRDTKRMVKCRELRQRCKQCNKKIKWNIKNACEECDKVIRCSLVVMNDDSKQEVKDMCEMNVIMKQRLMQEQEKIR